MGAPPRKGFSQPRADHRSVNPAISVHGLGSSSGQPCHAASSLEFDAPAGDWLTSDVRDMDGHVRRRPAQHVREPTLFALDVRAPDLEGNLRNVIETTVVIDASDVAWRPCEGRQRGLADVESKHAFPRVWLEAGDDQALP